MQRFSQSILRYYYKLIEKNKINKLPASDGAERHDFKKLKYTTKVPQQPVIQELNDSSPSIKPIDSDYKTIQLLERLSLVDLDSKEALSTLQSSIQFGNKIASIKTDGVEALYSVLANQTLRLRADTAIESNTREEILSNSKITEEDYFVSPPGNIPLEQDDKIKF